MFVVKACLLHTLNRLDNSSNDICVGDLIQNRLLTNVGIVLAFNDDNITCKVLWAIDRQKTILRIRDSIY